MTKDQATIFLADFEAKKAEANYLAHFKTSVPLPVSNPELFDKAIEAKIALGTFKWQRPYAQIIKIDPSISLERYQGYRKKYKLD